MSLKKHQLYYLANREKVLAKQAAYREANREKRNAHMRLKRTDPVYREWRNSRVRRTGLNWEQYLAAIKVSKEHRQAEVRMHIQVIRALRSSNAHVCKYLCCSGPDLRRHLEAQFAEGMTWDNYGTLWCVDHKKAVGLYDLADPNQFAECAHYTNLRPLLVSENCRQGGAIIKQRLAQAAAKLKSGII